MLLKCPIVMSSLFKLKLMRVLHSFPHLSVQKNVSFYRICYWRSQLWPQISPQKMHQIGHPGSILNFSHPEFSKTVLDDPRTCSLICQKNFLKELRSKSEPRGYIPSVTYQNVGNKIRIPKIYGLWYFCS